MVALDLPKLLTLESPAVSLVICNGISRRRQDVSEPKLTFLKCVLQREEKIRWYLGWLGGLHIHSDKLVTNQESTALEIDAVKSRKYDHSYGVTTGTEDF